MIFYSPISIPSFPKKKHSSIRQADCKGYALITWITYSSLLSQNSWSIQTTTSIYASRTLASTPTPAITRLPSVWQALGKTHTDPHSVISTTRHGFSTFLQARHFLRECPRLFCTTRGWCRHRQGHVQAYLTGLSGSSTHIAERSNRPGLFQ